MIFWWRRWMEQSLPNRDMALPYWSARSCTSKCRADFANFITKIGEPGTSACTWKTLVSMQTMVAECRFIGLFNLFAVFPFNRFQYKCSSKLSAHPYQTSNYNIINTTSTVMAIYVYIPISAISCFVTVNWSFCRNYKLHTTPVTKSSEFY